MKKIELSGIDQRILEQRCLLNIRDCNAKIRKNTATYNNYGNADERLRANYTREEYKQIFVDHWYEVRRDWIMKLRDVRNGVIYE